MENETSTTVVDNSGNSDGAQSAATSTDSNPNTATEKTQTAEGSDNLEPSKSTDKTSADGDKPTGEEAGEDTPASKFDEDIDNWIEKRGLPAPTNDEQKQKYQDLRNEQREFTRARQAEKAAQEAETLRETIKDSDPNKDVEDDDDDEEDEIEKTVKELKADRDAERTTRLQSEFYTSNKVTEEQGKLMTDIFKEKMERPGMTPEQKKSAFEYWSKPSALPELLEQAKAREIISSQSSVKEEAAQQERERIAKESEANPSSRGAKNVSTQDLTPDQKRLAKFRGELPWGS